jgi:TolB-like protein
MLSEIRPALPVTLKPFRAHGYRFIAPVMGQMESDKLANPTLANEDTPSPPPGGRRAGQRWIWFALAGFAAVVLVGAWFLERQHHAGEPISSLAVLPLDNLSGDSSQDYFADGMTDELITMLAKDSSLRIVSRTSVMQYRGARRPLPEIARALHADAILEGSVSRSADQVHMTLQLIRADTDSHLWADSYERDANDVALPDEAAKAIANQLHRAVPAVKANRYVSPAAHDAYLHGKYLWFGDRMEESRSLVPRRRSISSPIMRWPGRDSPTITGRVSPAMFSTPAPASFRRSRQPQRALELDPDLPQAHQAMGAMFLIDRWDWADADREILRAISLDPQNGELYYLRACVLQAVNRNAEAIELGKKAMEIDPFSRPYALASLYVYTRQFDAALKEIRLRLEANPNNLDLLGLEMDTLRRMGNYKEAVDTWARWHILTGDPQSAVNLRRAWDRGGARGFVRWQLGRRLLQSKSHYVSPVELASYYAQLGDKERTLALLEEGYRQRATDTLWIQGDPAYDFLHADRSLSFDRSEDWCSVLGSAYPVRTASKTQSSAPSSREDKRPLSTGS